MVAPPMFCLPCSEVIHEQLNGLCRNKTVLMEVKEHALFSHSLIPFIHNLYALNQNDNSQSRLFNLPMSILADCYFLTLVRKIMIFSTKYKKVNES